MIEGDAKRSTRPRSSWLIGAALFLGALALYGPVGWHPFIFFDDNRYVLENVAVRHGLTWSGAAWAFRSFEVANWHPLTWLSHMLDVQLFGLNPGAHHLVNAVFHAINSFLVFLLFRRLTGATWRSAFVAALFAVHPTHVESVAWVAERKDVLSTFLGLLALVVYSGYARNGGVLRFLGVAILFAASLLAKPMWVTLPFLLLLLDVWPLQRLAPSPIPRDPGPRPCPTRSLPRLLLEKLPLLALSAASSVVTLIAQHRGGAIAGLELGIGSRMANAAVSYLRYVGKTVWPWPLSIYYSQPAIGSPGWMGLGAGAILLTATALAIRASPRRPWLGLGWLWFLGTLVPVIGLVQVGSQSIADRYTYVPALGLYLVTVWGVAEAGARAGRAILAPVAGVLAVGALAAVTWIQLGFWSDHVTLFRHAVAVDGESGIVHGVLSEGLRRANNPSEALLEAETAVRLAPTSGRHWNTLGLAYRELGRYGEARDALLRASALDSGHPAIWVNLGHVEMDLGNPPGAILAYERAVALGTDVGSVWSNLAVLYHGSGRTAEAASAFERAVEIDPGSASAWFNLGLFRLRTGQYPASVQALSVARQLDPSSPEIARRLEEARSRSAALGPR